VERSPSLDAFLRDPIGRWFSSSERVLVFCAGPSLGGAVAWGRPTRDDTERLLRAFEGGFRHPKVAPTFDVVLDGRAIEGVDPDGLEALLGWLAAQQAELATRIGLQFGVIADTVVGVTLAGILPTLGDTHRFRVVRDPREAFRALSKDGDALCDALERAVALVRSVPRELGELREKLRAGGVARASLASLARALGVSPRTLQRVLQETGTTFRDEVRDARFAVASALLVDGDEKIAGVARRVGLSETALTELVREKTGATPAELRRRSR
jgi:AraC-like DNA-binding protein